VEKRKTERAPMEKRKTERAPVEKRKMERAPMEKRKTEGGEERAVLVYKDPKKKNPDCDT
jgi:hypothetical protein